MSVLWENAIGYGLHADRPAPGAPGALYFESDTGNGYRDNGVTWDLIVPAGGGGGTGLWAGIYGALSGASGGSDLDLKLLLGDFIVLLVSQRRTTTSTWTATTARHTVTAGKVLVALDVRVGAQVIQYDTAVDLRLHDLTADMLLAGYSTYDSFGFPFVVNETGQAVMATVPAGNTVAAEAYNSTDGDRLLSGVWICQEVDAP